MRLLSGAASGEGIDSRLSQNPSHHGISLIERLLPMGQEFAKTLSAILRSLHPPSRGFNRKPPRAVHSINEAADTMDKLAGGQLHQSRVQAVGSQKPNMPPAVFNVSGNIDLRSGELPV